MKGRIISIIIARGSKHISITWMKWTHGRNESTVRGWAKWTYERHMHAKLGVSLFINSPIKVYVRATLIK